MWLVVSQPQLIEDQMNNNQEDLALKFEFLQATEFFFFADLITILTVILANSHNEPVPDYKYSPLSQGVAIPEAVKETHSINSDEETMALFDSNSSNYIAQ